MRLTLNGREQDVQEGVTIDRVLSMLEVGPGARGVAVAVDAQVVPRAQWPHRRLAAGERVEVVTAMQGG